MKTVAYIVERAMAEAELSWRSDPDALRNTPLVKKEDAVAAEVVGDVLVEDCRRQCAKQLEAVLYRVPKTLAEYHEDQGAVVWWKFPVNEPAWIGTPSDSDWPGYHTHWTPHPTTRPPT